MFFTSYLLMFFIFTIVFPLAFLQSFSPAVSFK
jgi:hypothetical protein